MILRLLHVSSSNVRKTTLHRALANDGYPKQIVFCAVGYSTTAKYCAGNRCSVCWTIDRLR